MCNKTICVIVSFQLVGKPTGMGKPMDVPVEVTIGTVPLRKTESGTPMLTVKAAARGGQDPSAVTKKRSSPSTARSTK